MASAMYEKGNCTCRDQGSDLLTHLRESPWLGHQLRLLLELCHENPWCPYTMPMVLGIRVHPAQLEKSQIYSAKIRTGTCKDSHPQSTIVAVKALQKKSRLSPQGVDKDALHSNHVDDEVLECTDTCPGESSAFPPGSVPTPLPWMTGLPSSKSHIGHPTGHIGPLPSAGHVAHTGVTGGTQACSKGAASFARLFLVGCCAAGSWQRYISRLCSLAKWCL